MHTKKTISLIRRCTCPISHNAPFRPEMCIFMFWMMNCGIWDRCIMAFVNWFNCCCLLSDRRPPLSCVRRTFMDIGVRLCLCVSGWYLPIARRVCLALVACVHCTGVCLALVSCVHGTGVCLALVSCVHGTSICLALVARVPILGLFRRHLTPEFPAINMNIKPYNMSGMCTRFFHALFCCGYITVIAKFV